MSNLLNINELNKTQQLRSRTDSLSSYCSFTNTPSDLEASSEVMTGSISAQERTEAISGLLDKVSQITESILQEIAEMEEGASTQRNISRKVTGSMKRLKTFIHELQGAKEEIGRVLNQPKKALTEERAMQGNRGNTYNG